MVVRAHHERTCEGQQTPSPHTGRSAASGRASRGSGHAHLRLNSNGPTGAMAETISTATLVALVDAAPPMECTAPRVTGPMLPVAALVLTEILPPISRLLLPAIMFALKEPMGP